MMRFVDLARTALDHLWLHFTDMGGYADPADLQVIVKGDGCFLEDSNGRRYLDALAGLFCVNVGLRSSSSSRPPSGRCSRKRASAWR
ncbi:MAG: hypothetical protein QOD71_1369 [Thermoleophilaceae bacterium]|jgi:adenosylmethionine-8-amino-7-oxononanoate aminotransferase|nr:hypothetical protein [Thermoleophilaceae bacterium]